MVTVPDWSTATGGGGSVGGGGGGAGSDGGGGGEDATSHPVAEFTGVPEGVPGH